MRRKFLLPDNEVILYILALAQTLGFAYAGLMYEGSSTSLVMQVIAGARGLLLGGALSFGAAVAAQKAPRIQSRRARRIGYLALGGLLVVSPVIMAPAIMAAMPESLRSLLAPAGLWAVAISLAAAPDLVAVAVAAQSGSLQPLEAKPATAERPLSEKKRPLSETKSAQAFACADCEREFTSLNALNAHRRSHKPIKVDPALLIKKD